MKITVNGKELSLEGALPLTLGDLRKMKASGINLERMDVTDPEVLHKLLLHLFQKASGGGAVTAEDVDALTVPQLGELSDHIRANVGGEADRPT